eukprot:9345888-Lingulodinium_polyedra.AAC.1
MAANQPATCQPGRTQRGEDGPVKLLCRTDPNKTEPVGGPTDGHGRGGKGGHGARGSPDASTGPNWRMGPEGISEA